MREPLSEYAFEALVSRLTKTLQTLFPGAVVKLERNAVGHTLSGRYDEYTLTLETEHPGLGRGKCYRSCQRIPAEHFYMEGDDFIRHLMKTAPQYHIHGIVEAAIQHAHETRYG